MNCYVVTSLTNQVVSPLQCCVSRPLQLHHRCHASHSTRGSHVACVLPGPVHSKRLLSTKQVTQYSMPAPHHPLPVVDCPLPLDHLPYFTAPYLLATAYQFPTRISNPHCIVPYLRPTTRRALSADKTPQPTICYPDHNFVHE